MVVWPNYSTQGIAVLADTLALNGGTIRAAASDADADLAHSGLGHDPAHKVDWRPSQTADNVALTVICTAAQGDRYRERSVEGSGAADECAGQSGD